MNHKKVIILGLTAIILIGGFFVFSGNNYSLDSGLELSEIAKVENIIPPPQKLNPPPSPIRGIYITSWVAGTTSRLNDLINLVNSTELNAVVIDVKDYSGYLSFKTSIPLAEEIGAHNEPRVSDMDSLIRRLHKDGIYVIARVQVFQDPILANARPELAIKNLTTGEPWKDNAGLAWLDPAGRIAWDYTLDIINEIDTHGFDEINLDYIRFPSDGDLSKTSYPFWDEITPRYNIIGDFFSYLKQRTQGKDIVLSADLFGLTAWHALDPRADLNIGQRMMDALANFSFVSPMVYPSHYGPGINGYAVPAEHPYEIVFTSLKNTQDLVATTSTPTAGLRPWLQDFSLAVDYTEEDVKAQIQATYDNGIDEWLLWNAANYYTRGALEAN